jgi:5,10-methylenetetrahydromethanopterin reductase
MYPSINLMPEAPVRRLLEVASEAERLGYRRCWVYDEGLAARDVYVVLTAIASATTTISIGTGITNPYTRHPAISAAAIATLDEMSEGRAFLGWGAGGSLSLDPLALARTTPLAAVEDAIVAARALYGGGQVDLDRATLNLRSASLVTPARAIDIWLAGRGPRMLALGGRVADGVMLEFIHRDRLDDSFRLVTEAAAAAGRTVRLSYSTMVVTDSAALDLIRKHMAYRLVDSPPEVHQMLGITPADLDRLRAALAVGLEAAASLVPDEWVLPFVIHGSVEECGRQLAELAAKGVEEFLLPVLEIDTAEHLMAVTAAAFSRL